MEYIIFLATIQLPFLYLVWKLFQRHSSETINALRSLKIQQEHIANFMDTLKMSIERISEDIYGNGKVNSRMFQIEKEITDLKKCFNQMEIYTGLNTSSKTLEDISSSASLKEKTFR